MCIVSKSEKMFNYQMKVIDINQEQQRTQHRTLSDTMTSNKNWLFSGFEIFYSKSCNFIDSNQITLKTNLDDTYDGNEQCLSKINFKKGVVLFFVSKRWNNINKKRHWILNQQAFISLHFKFQAKHNCLFLDQKYL